MIARKNITRIVFYPPAPSFDNFLNQLFTLSLPVGTRARLGDIGYPPEDTPGKALQIRREVELLIESGEAILENVFLLIRISYYKGNR